MLGQVMCKALSWICVRLVGRNFVTLPHLATEETKSVALPKHGGIST